MNEKKNVHAWTSLLPQAGSNRRPHASMQDESYK